MINFIFAMFLIQDTINQQSEYIIIFIVIKIYIDKILNTIIYISLTTFILRMCDENVSSIFITFFYSCMNFGY